MESDEDGDFMVVNGNYIYKEEILLAREEFENSDNSNSMDFKTYLSTVWDSNEPKEEVKDEKLVSGDLGDFRISGDKKNFSSLIEKNTKLLIKCLEVKYLEFENRSTKGRNLWDIKTSLGSNLSDLDTKLSGYSSEIGYDPSLLSSSLNFFNDMIVEFLLSHLKYMKTQENLKEYEKSKDNVDVSVDSLKNAARLDLTELDVVGFNSKLDAFLKSLISVVGSNNFEEEIKTHKEHLLSESSKIGGLLDDAFSRGALIFGKNIKDSIPILEPNINANKKNTVTNELPTIDANGKPCCTEPHSSNSIPFLESSSIKSKSIGTSSSTPMRTTKSGIPILESINHIKPIELDMKRVPILESKNAEAVIDNIQAKRGKKSKGIKSPSIPVIESKMIDVNSDENRKLLMNLGKKRSKLSKSLYSFSSKLKGHTDNTLISYGELISKFSTPGDNGTNTEIVQQMVWFLSGCIIHLIETVNRVPFSQFVFNRWGTIESNMEIAMWPWSKTKTNDILSSISENFFEYASSLKASSNFGKTLQKNSDDEAVAFLNDLMDHVATQTADEKKRIITSEFKILVGMLDFFKKHPEWSYYADQGIAMVLKHARDNRLSASPIKNSDQSELYRTFAMGLISNSTNLTHSKKDIKNVSILLPAKSSSDMGENELINIMSSEESISKIAKHHTFLGTPDGIESAVLKSNSGNSYTYLSSGKELLDSNGNLVAKVIKSGKLMTSGNGVEFQLYYIDRLLR